jgi:pyridoxal phosphate enzyme (YggS family)
MDESFKKQVEIQDNYNRIVERIEKAARDAGRTVEEIRLVVVTKTQPVDTVKYVVEAGARDIGENYVEEAIPKIQALTGNKTLRWHMIGHLQSRKAQLACEYFQYIHSLDSVKLAEKLCRFEEAIDKTLPVWLEFNISGEETKFGWNINLEENWNNILIDIGKILELPNLNILGLMTVPPFSDNPEEARPYFRQLKKFQEFVIGQLKPSNFTELSIGMSSDFEVAIQEGSTCVRIGQAILGPRPV